MFFPLDWVSMNIGSAGEYESPILLTEEDFASPMEFLLNFYEVGAES